MDPGHAVVLVLAGLAAGWVNTVAGAGGPVANGTVRVAVLAQSLVGATGYVRARALPRTGVVATTLPAVIGALGGALVATRLTARAVEILLVAAFAVALVSALYKPKPRDPDHPPRLGAPAIAGMVVAGFYGGLVQTGVGLVLLAVLTAIIGHDLLAANAIKVITTLVFSAVVLVVFALSGQVDWVPGLILGGGSMIGAWLGVRFAVTRGHEAIRVVVIVVTVAAAAIVILR